MLTAGIFLAVTAVPYVLVHPERRVLLRGVPDSRSGVRQGNVDRVRASRHVRPVLRATKTFGKEGFTQERPTFGYYRPPMNSVRSELTSSGASICGKCPWLSNISILTAGTCARNSSSHGDVCPAESETRTRSLLSVVD